MLKKEIKIEWIPTFQIDDKIEVRIDEWATWTADLNTNLEVYYKLDETSGTMIDSVGNYNGTNYSATATTSGNITSIEKTLNIPTVAATENLPFYWEIFLNDGSTITTITTSSNNQSVSPLYAINITDLTCQAGYFEAVNFTFLRRRKWNCII